MQDIIKWKIIPMSEPEVVKACPKCGGNAHFESSHKFRVNANQSKLDVWLIYQCKKCKATWNMTILSRVNPRDIPKAQYQKYLDNDKALARFYAFDVESHRRNGSVLSYEEIDYLIQGEKMELGEFKKKSQLIVECEEIFDVRIDKILSKQLGISREQVKKMTQEGILNIQDEKKLWKAKLKNKMIIHIEE